MFMAEPSAEWRHRVVRALGTVVVVGLVIGGVLGAVAYSAARAAGLAGGETQTSATDESTAGQPLAPRVSPSAAPTAAKHPVSKDERRADQRVGHHAKQRHDKPKRKHTRSGSRTRLTLAVSPRQVRPMGRIHLMGRYPGHGGTRLVVQRFEGGRWARFPVSATVRSGRFRTWVASGHRGVNRFRVIDAGTRRASAPVTVRVR